MDYQLSNRLNHSLFHQAEVFSFSVIRNSTVAEPIWLFVSIPLVVLKTADASFNPYHREIKMVNVLLKDEIPMFFSSWLLSPRLSVSLLMEFRTHL